MLTIEELNDINTAAIILDDPRKFPLEMLDLCASQLRKLTKRLEDAGPIIDFDLQTGEGTNVEIIGKNDNELALIIGEDTLIKMIQLAFDEPAFTIDDLIDALRSVDRREGEL